MTQKRFTRGEIDELHERFAIHIERKVREDKMSGLSSLEWMIVEMVFNWLADQRVKEKS